MFPSVSLPLRWQASGELLAFPLHPAYLDSSSVPPWVPTLSSPRNPLNPERRARVIVHTAAGAWCGLAMEPGASPSRLSEQVWATAHVGLRRGAGGEAAALPFPTASSLQWLKIFSI